MAETKWTLDPAHSSISFSVRHMMITNVRGHFDKFTVDVTADPANLKSAKATITIDVNSINTKEEQRDAHLRSPDFFNVEIYPTITFQVKSITHRVKDEYIVTGDLTIAGVTKTISLSAEISEPTKDPWGVTKLGLVADATINRSDFGLVYNAVLETGGILVGDAIKMHVELEFAQG